MKRITKVLLVAVLVLMLVLPFAANKEKAYAAAKKPDYLTDEVGVIPDESAKMIEEEAERLKDKYGASVYSIIQDNYSGDIDDYAYDLYKEMGFETEDNCDVVLFIFEEAGEYWSIQGLGIEHEMDSERLSSILANYFASAFSDYHTDKAILNFIDGMDLFYKDFFNKKEVFSDDAVSITENAMPNNGCYNCGYNCANCGLNCGGGCIGCGIGCGSCLASCMTNCLRNCAYNCGGYGCGCGRGLGLFSCLAGSAFSAIFPVVIILFIVFAIFGSIGGRRYGYGYRPRSNFFFFGNPARPRGPRPGGFGGGFGGPRPGGFSSGVGGSRPSGSGGSRTGGSSGGSRGAGGKR